MLSPVLRDTHSPPRFQVLALDRWVVLGTGLIVGVAAALYLDSALENFRLAGDHRPHRLFSEGVVAFGIWGALLGALPGAICVWSEMRQKR